MILLITTYKSKSLIWRCFKIKTAFEGLYTKGKIIPKEEINYNGNARVLIVFLDDFINEENKKKEKLLSTFGKWEDERNSEEIISDLYSSR
jgi:hypothetical protein